MFKLYTVVACPVVKLEKVTEKYKVKRVHKEKDFEVFTVGKPPYTKALLISE